MSANFELASCHLRQLDEIGRSIYQLCHAPAVPYASAMLMLTEQTRALLEEIEMMAAIFDLGRTPSGELVDGGGACGGEVLHVDFKKIAAA